MKTQMGRLVWLERPPLVWSGAALVAPSPQFIYLSVAMNNDIIAAATGTAVLLLSLELVLPRAHAIRPGGLPATLEMQRLHHPPPWTDRAQLVGYQVDGKPCPGGTLRWTLIWHVTRTPTEDVYYHWFNHLLDQDEQLQGQQDGPSLLPAYWRAGDTILNWLDIAIAVEAPTSDYTTRACMYVYPSIENVPLKDRMGQPSKERVEIGPIPVRPSGAGR